MEIMGISPLDKDATVSLVEDGQVLFAAGEECLGRQKQHASFPHRALTKALEVAGTKPEEIDQVAYAFLTAEQETRLIRKNILGDGIIQADGDWRAELGEPLKNSTLNRKAVPGFPDPNQRMKKGGLKKLAYWCFATAPGFKNWMNLRLGNAWANRAIADHWRWQLELESSLEEHHLGGKLKRYEHHLSHAVNAYLMSGMERSLIVILDGYGSGLAGDVSLGEGGRIKCLQNIRYPSSLGTFYENVTAVLGYKPAVMRGKL